MRRAYRDDVTTRCRACLGGHHFADVDPNECGCACHRPRQSMQNTHWYRSGWTWTSNPMHAQSEAEVERVGLHSCTTLECETPHGGSAEEYVLCKAILRTYGSAEIERAIRSR